MEVPQANGPYHSCCAANQEENCLRNLHKNFLANLATELLTHSVLTIFIKFVSYLSNRVQEDLDRIVGLILYDDVYISFSPDDYPIFIDNKRHKVVLFEQWHEHRWNGHPDQIAIQFFLLYSFYIEQLIEPCMQIHNIRILQTED